MMSAFIHSASSVKDSVPQEPSSLQNNNTEKANNQLPNCIPNESKGKVIELLGNSYDDILIELKQLNKVPNPFECKFCKSKCVRFDHLEHHDWWWEADLPNYFIRYECYVCYEKFMKKEDLKVHQDHHIKMAFS